mmetsp:Transcript_8019/g.12556  ORF Transcript_8019/g.12556 Transcript_8019/m.12556 type:complete len:551 (+) Transcript_8019:72-1724(+)
MDVVRFIPTAATCYVTAIILTFVSAVYLFRYLKFVNKDQQLIVNGLTEKTIVNGPKILFLPLTTRSTELCQVLSLGSTEYCIIKNTLQGERRVEVGPKLIFLKAYDKIIPCPYQKTCRKAFSLKANEYIRFLDHNTGKVRVLRGERGCVVPGPEEVVVDGDKCQAIDLQIFEYIKIKDKKSGAVRVERGEQLVFLGPFEEFLGKKQTAVEIDEETAVLVRNKRDGQQHLVTEKKLFIPTNDEELLEVRKLQKLADYEACIVRNKNGKDSVYFGSNKDQRSFFLEPYSQLVMLKWSRGRRREYRDLLLTKLDLRPMYMSFEFNCRTSDNVELILEGSFFWEIVNLPAMLKFTNDTTGDICNHARSRFIELVSQRTLMEFMQSFNVIAEEVHQEDKSGFYGQRGVKIHSLEVTGYHCADPSTATILSEIIQETTNRVNRLQQQESENEVQLKEIRGDIDEEKARSELLAIQTQNSSAKAEMEGIAEAQRVRTFLDTLSASLEGGLDLPSIINMWKTLRKEDALKAISTGNARVYFTPRDASISIESHEHTTE